VKDGEREQDEDNVGEPGVESSEVKTLWHMVGVEELEDIEVEEVEAVTALADQKKRAPGEDRRDGMGAAEAKDERSKYRRQETAMHQEIRSVSDQGVEEDANDDEADGRENETLTWSQDESMLQFAQRDASEKGTNIRQRSVLEETNELGGAVSINWAHNVVGVEVEVERVGDEAHRPKSHEKKDQVQGLFGPGQTDEPGEGSVEDTLAGEGP
jgi:hypothetical protein